MIKKRKNPNLHNEHEKPFEYYESKVLELGYIRIKHRGKFNQKIYYNGEYYISFDKTNHNGGVWKKAKKIEHLFSKDKRMGTYDETTTIKIGK